MENKIIKAGTKIVIGMDAGIAGTDAMQAFILARDTLEDELNDTAWYMGIDHAESYGIYPMSDLEGMSEEEELAEIDESDYSDNIEGWWDLYNEEKHARHCMTGTDREVHFNIL